jgi:nitroreductase
MILDLVKKRHSTRVYNDSSIDKEELLNIIECGQNYPSRGNLQPLKYILITDKNIRDNIFDTVLWGSKNSSFKAFKNKNYAPSNYIVVCVDKKIVSAGYEYEIGASIEAMLLAATEKNIASLWIKSFDRSLMSNILGTDDDIIIDSLVCLGYSNQNNIRVAVKDSPQVTVLENLDMITPKRDIKEVLYENRYNK